MNRSLVAPKFFFSLALCAALAGGVAQAQPAKEYQPEVGQAGKDVVWVPTPQALVDKMLDMAKLTPKDYLIDLGSGDGRTVITAATRMRSNRRFSRESRVRCGHPASAAASASSNASPRR